MPAPPDEATTKPGDLWILGDHRLLCGDSTKPEHVARLMEGATARMLFTDPPWNVGIGQDSNPRHRQRPGLQNDSLPPEAFRAFLDGFVGAIKEHVTGDFYCVLGASEWPTLDSALRGHGYHWSATIIWVKDTFVLGRSKYHRRYEPIWFGWHTAGKSSFGDARNLDDVWEVPRPKRSEEHPTMKPVELVIRAIQNSSLAGDLVVDPFGGSALDQAADLLNRAIERLPNETMLHRLKAEVDSEAQKLEAKRFVESAIAQAKDLFASSPTEALGVLQSALDRMPGEERLLAYERSLRQQLDALQVEQVYAGTLQKARESMAAKQYDKAIVTLESFQLEYGHHADMDDLLAFARDEQKRLQRGSIIERCASEGRALIREGRLDEAIQLLQAGIQETGDASLSRLLEEIREQQAAFVRKLELLEKRVGLLRERGELDEAIQLLQEQLATMPGNPALQNLLTVLQADQQQKKQAEFARQIQHLQEQVAQLRRIPDLHRRRAGRTICEFASLASPARCAGRLRRCRSAKKR